MALAPARACVPSAWQPELEELSDLVTGMEALRFLRTRVEKFRKEGADLPALVSAYRLTARALKDELQEKDQTLDQFRREFQKMRASLDDARKREASSSAQAGGQQRRGRSRQGPGGFPATATGGSPGSNRDRLLVDFQNMRNR